MRKKLSEREIFERSIREEDVFGAVRAILELNRARVHRVVERIPWGPKGRKSDPGIPDTFGWFIPNGDTSFVPTFFFIELKRPHGAEYRPAQLRWIEEARRDGVIAFFADSVDAVAKGFAEFGIKLRGL